MLKLMMAMVVGLTCVSAPAWAQDKKDVLTESQALGAALASNLSAYQTAAIVAARTQDPEVRSYAMRVVQDYEKANRDLLNLVEKGNLTVADSPLRDKIVSAANKDMGTMWSKEAGAELDKQFLTYMIEDQRNDLTNFDQSMIPGARSKDLKDVLTNERMVANEHFQQACTLGRRLGAETEGCPTAPGTR